MKLQAKSIIAILAAFCLSGFLAIAVFNRLLLEEFRDLEHTQATRDTERVVQAWQQETRSLISRTQDWSFWDDTYRFVDDHYDEYVQSNLVYTAVQTINFEHIIYLNRALDLSYGVQINKKTKTLDPLDRDIRATIISSKVFQGVFTSGTSSGGFIQTAGKTFLVAASPIRDSAEEKAPNGVLIFTREISEEVVRRIAEQTKLNVEISTLEHGPAPSPPNAITSFLTSFSPPSFEIKGESLVAETSVKDLLGAPVLKLRTTLSREIFHKGLAARTFLISAYIGIACVTAMLVIALIHFLVISRLARLNKQLTAIADSANFSGRITIGDGDEIGAVGSRINDTLSALDEAQSAIERSRAIAEAANLAKSTFIAKVSHELRTPIHSITGMLRILRKSETSSARRGYISLARAAAYGLLETINEILDFSKAEAGKLRFERIEFSLREVVREALAVIGERVDEKDALELCSQIQPETPDRLFGDPHRLKQVIINLLGNAAKFTPAGWIGLQISPLREDEHQTVLTIDFSDTGIGIPEDRLGKIFEPFTQADDTGSRIYSGTGLGLTIVKQIVEGMNGTISVASIVGVGSTFTLSIPFERVPYSHREKHEPTLKTKKVALINPNTEVMRRYAQDLSELNYEPHLIDSSNVPEVMGLRRNLASFGLVIVMSGSLRRSAVFDLVAEAAHSGDVPLVALLSPSELKLREQLTALKVPFVLTKPITLEDILGVLAGTVQTNLEQWDDREDTSVVTGRPLSILIADDVLTNRLILEDLLKDAGHSVTSVVNGLELVERVERSLSDTNLASPYDIVLTDIQMPLMDGLSATSKIRSIEGQSGTARHLPIVAITAHALEDESSRIRAAGVDSVITKPLDPLRLAEVIRALTTQGSPRPLVQTSLGVATQSERDLVSCVDRAWQQLSWHGDETHKLFETGEASLSVTSILDLEEVHQRSGGSTRRTLLIYSAFNQCFQEHLSDLRDARASGDLEALRRSAHTMKGMLLEIGAKSSATLASSIEDMCRKGSAAEARSKAHLLVEQVLIIARLVEQISKIADIDDRTVPPIAPDPDYRGV